MRCFCKSVAIIAALLFFPLTNAGPAHAASAEDFRTQEYLSSRALDVINAANAYALGYTGAGQTIGILDTPVRVDHPELAGKAETLPAYINGEPVNLNWTADLLHGSHVAGIIAAKRDGAGMHGVAFNATLWAGPLLSGNVTLDPMDIEYYFSSRPEVRIYNNSWGATTYIDVFDEDLDDMYGAEEFFNDLVQSDYDINSIVSYADAHRESVFVFAAGNNGQIAPNVPTITPRFLGNGDLANWISVGALNTSGITRDAQGNLSLNSSAISWFSNLAYGAELFTVMAPGSNIYSLNAVTNGYMLESGTSMAAPVVSGALALVAQAYPWMTGKQLADSILTTANNTFAAPEYAVLYDSTDSIVRLVAIDRDELTIGGTSVAIDQLTRDQLKELIRASYEQDPSAWLSIPLEYIYKSIDNGSYEILSLTKEQVFGQGILDVGKAVQGIGRLDANRMTAENVVALDELDPGREDALETFDTKGYTAEFSNDISQREWDDAYHHPDNQTGGSDPELTEDANALDGKNVGIRKTGPGMLILSGDNTYSGATVVDEGVLAVARRTDGTGGILENSDVLVRYGGTLAGDGEIRQRVVNSGVTAPGFTERTLSVGEYEQTRSGTLLIAFNNNGQYTALNANTAAVAGNLAFAPERNVFYANDFLLYMDNFLQAANITGAFTNVGVENLSPTLTPRLIQYDAQNLTGTVRMERAADAYSRYADNAGAASLGRALPGIAGAARGDMQNLLTALDWSARDGRDVRRALVQLGTEAYDAAARAALSQQNEFNILLLTRMLDNGKARRLIANRHENGPQAENWQVWATPYASGVWQNGHDGFSKWRSAGIGLLAGVDRRFADGLTIGAHMALAARRTDVDGEHDARADTQSAFVGMQGLFAPDAWNGFYLTAQGRLGLESGEMERDVAVNGYYRHNESDWMGFAGGALLGAGKDWSWNTENGLVTFGPLSLMEYAFLRRPSISEHDGKASRLNVDDMLYQSLLFSLGAHAGFNTALDNGSALALELLTAWRHELLDATFRTDAAFRDYGAYGFTSATELPGRDALLVQGSLRLTNPSNFFAQVNVGGEFFRKDYAAANVSLHLGWEF